MSLHTRMLIGFVAGTVLGLAANLFAADAGWLDVIVTYVADDEHATGGIGLERGQSRVVVAPRVGVEDVQDLLAEIEAALG